MAPIAGLRCTVCRSPDLGFAHDAITCGQCGQECPILGGVPVMFEAVSVKTDTPDSVDTTDGIAASQVLAAFGLADDPLSRLRIRTLMRKQVTFGGALIQVESRQFLERVRNTGHAIEAGESTGKPAGRETRDLVTVPRYGWSKTYVPRRISPGDAQLANVRIENRGVVPLFRAGAGRAMLAQRWEHRDGSPAATLDERTPLPIDLHPAQSVTVAVRLAPPSRPGAYRLTLTLVQEQVRWLDEDCATFAVKVDPEAPGAVPDGWSVRPGPPTDYDADHVRGLAIMGEWLRQHAPERPRVLEVGGNALPMAALLDQAADLELVNVDVDLLGLQVGHMLARQHGRRVTQLCADAFDLPFPAGYFDAIVLFASLHHFPDPAALLDHLRRRLRPGGFIGLFCEPVGHIWPGAITPAFLAELERGVNEQSFSLREYELMFRRAELMPTEVVVDVDSLKARLVHAATDVAR